MQIARDFAHRLRPPAFFRQPDSVFAGNHAAPRQNLREKFVESAIDFFAHGCLTIVPIRHDVDVNVAVAGVTETRDRKSMFVLQLLRELDKIDNTTSRNDHVLVQFRQASRTQ